MDSWHSALFPSQMSIKKHFLRTCAFFFAGPAHLTLLCLLHVGGVSDFTRQILIFMLTVKHAEKI
jgi:hypothetical protein